MTAAAEAAPPLAPQWDAQLRALAALIKDVAESGDLALATGTSPKAVAYWLIDAYRLIAAWPPAEVTR
jgi:hypothetical protein